MPMSRLTAGLALCLLLAPPAALAQESPEPAPPAPAATPAPDATPSYPSLHIIGFSDLDFATTDEDLPASNSRFFEGQLVLHLTSELSSHFTFIGEISMTARPEAAVNASA